MKKFLCILLSLLITTPMLIIGASADNSDFTKEEAEALLIEGYQRMMLVYYGHIEEYSGDDAYKYLKADLIEGDSVFKKPCLSYTLSSKGEKYYREISDCHVLVTDERFNTMEKCYEYMGHIFEASLAKKIIDENPHAEYWKEKGGAPVESFRPSDGGMIWDNDADKWVEYEKGKVVFYLFASTHTQSGMIEEILKSIGQLTVNGDMATMKVDVEIKEVHLKEGAKPEGAKEIPAFVDPPYSTYLVPYEKKVTFVRTSDGWRISGGSFFDILMLEENVTPNPSTSDSTPIIITLLTLSGIVLACVPAVKRKKR